MSAAPQPIVIGLDEAKQRVLLTPKQRAYHTHIIGGIGKGKTTLLQQMVCQDIVRGHGLCLIDPHGGLYQEVLKWCAASGYGRMRRIHLINPSCRTHALGFNPLWTPSADLNEILDRVDAVMDAVSQVWGGEDVHKLPTFQRIFSALAFAVACKRLTLVETPYLVPAERGLWREYLASDLPHAMMTAVWEEIQGYTRLEHRANFLSVFNRLDPFLRQPILQNMLGQQERVIDLMRCMEEGDIVLVNLQQQSGFSARTAELLGRLLINSLYATALRRAPERSRPFYLYIDECHRYLNDDIEGILSECRKYGLHLTLAHQHLGQLRAAGDLVCSAVMNVAVNKIVFSLGMEDAKLLADDLLGEQYDLEEPKKALLRPTVVGFERIRLRNAMRAHGQSEGWSETRGTASTSAEAVATGESFGGNTVTVFDADNNPISVAVGSSEAASRLMSALSSVTDSASESHITAKSVADSAGWGEALGPILSKLPGGLYSLDEQRFRAALALKHQGIGEAAVSLLGHRSKFIITQGTKKHAIGPEMLAGLEGELLSRSEYVSPMADVEREIRERQAALEANVRAFAGHPYTGGTSVELSERDLGWGP